MAYHYIQSIWRWAKQQYRNDWRLKLLSNKWYILIGLAIITYAMGYYGFVESFAAKDIHKPLLDYAYETFQLFTFKTGLDVTPTGWALQIARFVAPALTLYTFMLFLASYYLTMLRLSFIRDHVVICGMGYLGPVLAKNFYEWGYSVVVIEKDPTNNDLELCKDMGAITLVGDAKKLEFLRKARVDRARFIFTVTGDDGINSEIAMNCRKLIDHKKVDGRSGGLKRAIREWLYSINDKNLRIFGFRVYQAIFGGRERQPRCFVHIVDPKLCKLLVTKELAEESESLKMEFFNIYDTAGLSILKYPEPFIGPWENKHGGHILVIGLGRMGESLIVHAADSWRTVYGNGHDRLRITVIDRHAVEKRDLMLVRYPGIDRYCEINPLAMELQSSAFYMGDFLFDAGNKCCVSRVFICLDNESLGVSAALDLNRILLEHGIDQKEIRSIPVVVRTRHIGGLARLLNKIGDKKSIFDNIDAFPLVDATCNADIVLSDISDILARAIHETYVRYQQRIGNTPANKPGMQEWECLAEGFKDSNRDQAQHIWRRLHEINCGVALLVQKEKTPFKFKGWEIEFLAEKEHERFVVERRRAGWTDGDYNEENKASPYLIPYGRLTEDVKDYDREFIRQLPDILSRVDLKIVRLDEAGDGPKERPLGPVSVCLTNEPGPV